MKPNLDRLIARFDLGGVLARCGPRLVVSQHIHRKPCVAADPAAHREGVDVYLFLAIFRNRHNALPPAIPIREETTNRIYWIARVNCAEHNRARKRDHHEDRNICDHLGLSLSGLPDAARFIVARLLPS